MGTHTSATRRTRPKPRARSASTPTPTPDAATRSVLDSIRRIVRALRVSSRAAEKDLGLSGAQLFVLQRLADGGRALSLNELARRTVTDQSSVSVVVHKLVRLGLVRTARSRDDGRRMEMGLTAAGRKSIARSSGAARDRLIGSLAHMGAPMRRQLATLLERLVREAGIADAAPSLFFEPDPADPTPRPQRKSKGPT